MTKERKAQVFSSILLTVWIGALIGIVTSMGGVGFVIPALVLVWIVGMAALWT